MTIQKFLKLFHTTPDFCCKNKDKFLDEDTGEVVVVQWNTDLDKLHLYKESIIEKYAHLLIGSYVSYRFDKLNKPKYYRIESLDDASHGWIKLRQIKKHWVFSDRVVSKKGSSYGGKFKSMSKEEILENEGWHERKDFKYQDKYLYIFRSEIGRIKIGQAINVEERRKAIEMQSGMKILVVNMLENCAKYESILHKKYQHYRHIGEWFNLDVFQVNELSKINNQSIKQFCDNGRLE